MTTQECRGSLCCFLCSFVRFAPGYAQNNLNLQAAFLNMFGGVDSKSEALNRRFHVLPQAFTLRSGMKFMCQCGEIIKDQTDSLPWKGYLIPDQEWFPVFDAIDKIIDDTKAGLLEGEAPYTQLRNLLNAASQLIYQCPSCGRLFIYDRRKGAHVYGPDSEGTSKEILRSREETI